MFVIAKVLVVNEKGEGLAIRRSDTDERRPLQWDFPGGFVEDGEDITEAIKREAQEEAGLALDKLSLAYGKSEPAAEHGTGTWLLFVARVKGRPEVKLSFEHDQYAWMTIDQLLQAFTYDRQLNMLRFVKDNNLLDQDFHALS